MRAAILALATVLLLPLGARADWQVFTRLGARQIADSGLALVSESDTLFRAELGVSLGLSSHFGVELSTTLSGTSAPLFEEFAEASLSLTGLQGSGVAQAPLLPWLFLFGRGGVGVEFASLGFREDGVLIVSDLATVPAVQGTGGLKVRVQPAAGDTGRQQLAMELSAEGGYLLAPWKADFSELYADRDPDDEPLPAGKIPAGSLDLSGWLFQIGAALRF